MAQCYDWNSNTQEVEKLSDVWVQCPSGNTCCVGGSICLDYNLCHTPGSSTSDTGSYSSYYVARCSDPTYTSPDCQKVCDAPGPPDAVYNYTSLQWNCCGKDAAGNVSCDAPTSEVFQAPAPADLKDLTSGVAIVSSQHLAPGTKTSVLSSVATSSAASSGRTSSTLTTPTTGSSTRSSQPTQTNSSSSSTAISSKSSTLSTGAGAGIGVGVALLVLAIAAMIFFILRRRKRSAAPAAIRLNSAGNYSDNTQQHTKEQQYGKGQHYAGGTEFAIEKSADGVSTPRSELSSTNGLVGRGGVAGLNGGMFHEIGSSR